MKQRVAVLEKYCRNSKKGNTLQIILQGLTNFKITKFNKNITEKLIY